MKREVDCTCQQGILSHTDSPERIDVSERIHTETQNNITFLTCHHSLCFTVYDPLYNNDQRLFSPVVLVALKMSCISRERGCFLNKPIELHETTCGNTVVMYYSYCFLIR